MDFIPLGDSMKIWKNIFAATLVAASLIAHAESRTIEGRGVAKNRDGISATFAGRANQVDHNTPTGRFEISWMRGDVKISIVCESPRGVAVRNREGRLEGGAVVTVTKGADVRRWEGAFRMTAWDLKNAENPNGKDKIRVRFIRNPWESPEGDFFFEGEVTDGNLAVIKR